MKAAVESLSDSYNGKIILQQETAREEKAQKLIAEYKSTFIEQPHFTINFEKMNVSFDPRNIIPIEDKGTVYPAIRVTDLWGNKEAVDWALLWLPEGGDSVQESYGFFIKIGRAHV